MMALAPVSHAWKLGDLLDGLVELRSSSPGLADRQVSGLALRSRAVTPGCLFLASEEAGAHGLADAEEVKRRGATAILAEITPAWPLESMLALETRVGLPVIPTSGLRARQGFIADRFHGAPSTQIDVVGITGLQGKSTLCHLLAQALEPELPCGIVDASGSDPRGASGAVTDSVTLQWTLSDLLGRGARAVALGLSPESLEGSLVSAVRLSHLVLTRLAPDTSPDERRRVCKVADLADSLASRSGLDWLVLNLDDPMQRDLLSALPASICVAGYSLDADSSRPSRCDLLLRASRVDTMAHGLRMEVELVGAEEHETAELEVGLIGRFNAANILAVMAVKCTRGLPLERAVRELAMVRGAPGRMECFGGDEAPLVVVDSARTPSDLEKALAGLRLHRCRRLITVLGCDGGTSTSQRARMGATAERLSDSVILTDDNPRGAAGDDIIADMLSGASRPCDIRVRRQRGLAIRTAITLAGLGDAVLVAGKGRDTLQDMGELKVHFSDRAQVVEALREWREGHH